jgi:hypothetical protein
MIGKQSRYLLLKIKLRNLVEFRVEGPVSLGVVESVYTSLSRDEQQVEQRKKRN